MDTSVANRQTSSAPKDYLVPGAQEFILNAVSAQIDCTSAAGPCLPALQLISPAGDVMWTAVNTSQQVAAGVSANVSWFPGVSAPTKSTTGGLGPAILFDQTLTSTTATFDTGAGGIPQTHTDLLVVSYLRTDEAIVLREDGAIILDNDSAAADYKTQRIRIQNTTVDGWLGTASTGFNCLMCAGASAPAGVYAYSFCYIPNYTAAVQHGGIGIEAGIGSFADQPNWWMYVTNSRHNQAEAITQIQVTPNIGGGARFVAGSRLTIYGMG